MKATSFKEGTLILADPQSFGPITFTVRIAFLKIILLGILWQFKISCSRFAEQLEYFLLRFVGRKHVEEMDA